MRVGFGFDSHRLTEGRPLLLGGVKIDHPKGLLGHSDGDCVLHAVCDAILGAIGERDIGELFPDTDPKWKDAPSTTFVTSAAELLSERGMGLSNIDITIIAAQPPLGSHKPAIKNKLALLLGLSVEQVGVKAKRPEGFEEAFEDVIAVYAVVSIE